MSLFLILLALAGYALADFRIPNGQNATIEQFPYQVSLVYSKDLSEYCGGAIIGVTYVLTAMHCVRGFQLKPDRVQVRVGSRYIGRGGVLYKVKQITCSDVESYGPSHGVAILQLSEPIKFGTTVQPIAVVPKSTEAKHGQMVLATGWGSTLQRPGRKQPVLVYSDELLMVRLPLIDREMCNAAYSRESEVSDIRICAGGGFQWTLAGGNFGGSLVNEKRQLIGILSWTEPTRGPGRPGVFTNLAAPAVREFIQKNTPI